MTLSKKSIRDSFRNKPATQVVAIDAKRAKKRYPRIRYLVVLSLAAILGIKFYLLAFVIDPIVGTYGFMATTLIFVAFLFSYFRYKDPALAVTTKLRDIMPGYAGKKYAAHKEPLVSIIVPAKNEPVMIKETVRAFLNSSYKKVEIILVNDGSTDETGAVMDLLKKENPAISKVIHFSENKGKRKAMKEGILQSKPESEIIVVVDSDSVVDKLAIEKLVHVFDDPDVGAVTGHGRAINPDENMLTKLQDTWYDGQFSIMKGMESSFGSVSCCSGILSAYRKGAILPCLDRWSEDKFLGAEFRFGDDRHLTSYVLGGTKRYIDKQSKVWKVHYCESAVVYTEVPASFNKFVRQNIRWKKSWVRIFLFNAPFYYKDRPIMASICFYLQMSLSLLTPIVGCRALFILPVQGHFVDALVYLTGLMFIGLLFATEYRLRNPNTDRWKYRILMTLLSAFLLNFLLYYSILTIRKGSWLTR